MDCAGANFRRELQYLVESRSFLKCSFAGPLDHRAIGDWIAEGNAELYDIGSGIDSGEDDSRVVARSGSPQVT